MMTSKKMDKIIKLVKENNPRNNVEIVSNLLAVKQDLERLEKYKSAIKIINDALELYAASDEIGVENRSSFIDYEDSELLKEVLNYE